VMRRFLEHGLGIGPRGELFVAGEEEAADEERVELLKAWKACQRWITFAGAALPRRLGGLGVLPATEVAHAAYLSSWAVVAPHLTRLATESAVSAVGDEHVVTCFLSLRKRG